VPGRERGGDRRGVAGGNLETGLGGEVPDERPMGGKPVVLRSPGLDGERLQRGDMHSRRIREEFSGGKVIADVARGPVCMGFVGEGVLERGQGRLLFFENIDERIARWDWRGDGALQGPSAGERGGIGFGE